MRMKDSDDYITARAANPRTGRITPCTPDSPAEALTRKRRSQQHSPTLVRGPRPQLTKANEGRKISHGNNGSGHQKRGDGVDGDRFVVHMPSAREPQPYAYPGYSTEQIEALDHYKVKTRRVSSEGYDRRLLRERSGEEGALEDYIPPPHDRVFTAYGRVPGPFINKGAPPPEIFIRKRLRQDSKVCRTLQSAASHCNNSAHEGADTTGARGSHSGSSTIEKHSNAPSSIRSLHNHEHEDLPNAHAHNSKQAQNVSATVNPNTKIFRNLDKALNPLENSAATPATSQYYSPISSDDQHVVSTARSTTQPQHCDEGSSHARTTVEITDLRQLPKVKLVRPEQAALPVHQRREVINGRRQCSLGCRTETQGRGHCLDRKRVASAETVIHLPAPIFESSSSTTQSTPPPPPPPILLPNAESLTAHFFSLITYLGSLPLPNVSLLDILQDPQLPLEEKKQAIKVLLSLLVHALAICIFFGLVWKVGTAVFQLVEMVLWPIVLPLRVLRWIVTMR